MRSDLFPLIHLQLHTSTAKHHYRYIIPIVDSGNGQLVKKASRSHGRLADLCRGLTIMASLRDFLDGQHSQRIAKHVLADPEFPPIAADLDVAVTLVSSDDAICVIVAIKNGDIQVRPGKEQEGVFGLQAKAEHWAAFFSVSPVRPFQNFWGMVRVLGPDQGVEILGDKSLFARHARLTRLILERARSALLGHEPQARLPQPPASEVKDEDQVVGRYFWMDMESLGKVKIFYERAGSGPQDVLFLHTAGSDSRQYHSLMNSPEMLKTCVMVAFDMPGHGRSSLGSDQLIEGYALDEPTYLEAIRLVVSHLGLKKVIVCGASMGGSVCLAVAVNAQNMNVHGVIPCEAYEHHPRPQPIYQMQGADTSVLDPERIIGMCSPTSPAYFKRQIWWQYSSQGHNTFPGDLRYYFVGADVRGRIEHIDTEQCPVYMLTGEFDYSCTPEMSLETAQKIKGAKFEKLDGVGHFPLTENPEKVIPALLRAITHVQTTRKADQA